MLSTIDKTISSPVISEEAQVRARVVKDAFLGIKEKLSNVSKSK